MPKTAFDGMLSRNNVSDANVEEKKSCACISIVSPSSRDEPHYFQSDHANVLNLEFDDADTSMVDACSGAGCDIHLFDYDDARKVIEFIKANKDKSHFFIHCTAGVSRSGAVGFFTRQLLKSDYQEFTKQNPHICPNGFVLQTLNDAMNSKEINEMYLA
jgi:predicted protein tyrosine phosphatase